MPIINNNGERDISLKFIYHPVMEMVCSFHAISGETHNKDGGNIVSTLSNAVDEDLKNEITFFSNHYYQWLFILDLFSEIVSKEHIETQFDVDTTLAELECLGCVDFAYMFLGTTLNQASVVESWIENPDSVLLSDEIPLFQYISKKDVHFFISNVEDIKKRLLSTIKKYWDCHFCALWDRLEVLTSKEIELSVSIISLRNVRQFLAEQGGIVVGEKYIDIPHYPHLHIAVGDIEELIIIFSVFVGPRLFMHIHKPKFILYRHIFVAVPDEWNSYPEALPEILKALSDKTRLALFMALRDKQRSTKELAEIMDLSPSTISQHLAILKNVDLVEYVKDKKYVYYKINRHQMSVAVELFKTLM